MFLKDVLKFHDKFGIRRGNSNDVSKKLTEEEIRFRARFLMEELSETMTAMGFPMNTATSQAHIMAVGLNPNNYDELEIIDGLLDLVYVALGTLDLMHLNEDQIRDHWADIQRANISKERSTSANDPRSKRKNSLDIVKPDGWKGPDHKSVMDKHIQLAFNKNGYKGKVNMDE